MLLHHTARFGGNSIVGDRAAPTSRGSFLHGLAEKGGLLRSPSGPAMLLVLALTGSVLGQAASEPPNSADPVAALRESVLQGPYSDVPVDELFARYANTAGPPRRAPTLTLLARKQDTLPLLVRRLERGAESEKVDALLFLQKVGRWKEASPQVLAIVQDQRAGWMLRLRAIATAAVLGVREARQTAQELLHESEQEPMREVCAEALGYVGNGESLPALRQALSDTSQRVRVFAAGSLLRNGSDSGLSTLLELSRHPGWAIRTYAAERLGFAQSEAARQCLKEMRSDGVSDVQDAAEVSLLQQDVRRMTTQERFDRLSEVIKLGKRRTAVWAMDTLVAEFGSAAKKELARQLDKENVFLKGTAEVHLLRLNGEGN